MDEAASNGRRWQAPTPCPASTVLLGNPVVRAGEQRPEDLEAAALLRAFGSGNVALLASQAALDSAGDQVVERYHAAQAAIDAIDRFVSRERVVEARRAEQTVTQSHANDGAENLRRRVLPKWAVWVVLALAAVFDVAFVANVVQRIFGAGPSEIVYYIAYLPGIGMALCLLAAGQSLAEHLFRHRVRVTRSRRRGPLNPWLLLRRALWHWRPEEQTRQEHDLPWPRLAGPVILAVLAVGVLAAGAYVRSTQAKSFAALVSFQPVFVGLLVLLSVSAIAVKVLSHNPYADRAKEVAKDITDLEEQAKELTDAGRSELVAHRKAWNNLKSAITSAEGEAVRVVEEECARILDDRGRRGVEGPLRLPLTVLRWPEEGTEPSAEPVLPALRLDILQHARDVAAQHDPQSLQKAFDTLVAALHQQFRPVAAGTR
ncbi:hypothetical protein E1258_27115 [Micromonospora sp. KC207]|uniref:hypothetical protein n=1 Tax=Micromonospora sp. KC207 TaxID=2530377 RepID=UPI001047C4E4|nr:hypothetical protein [Micromonospora sp. KC207]TDC49522.1 hypothetical protein E1258_27115 [Micromonospora sp. KC207]